MLLDALKEENTQGESNEEVSRTLNDISEKNSNFGNNSGSSGRSRSYSIDETSIIEKGCSEKTEKDKLNTKERRNSRYYVRSGDKEAIQSRVNSVKRAINVLMEHSGLYDHKPKHGSRKHSLTALNISKNLSDICGQQSTPPPPSINIVSPTSTQEKFPEADGIVTCLSPFPDDNRRSSMEDYFFNSVSLPVPKQFADAASRRSSGVTETIKEVEGNGHSHENYELEYNYSIDYLNNSAENHCESAVPYEVYERNLLRASNQAAETRNEGAVSRLKASETNLNEVFINTLQVPMLQMSDIDMMERIPLNINPENVYTGDNMTIIETDNIVSALTLINFHLKRRSVSSKILILINIIRSNRYPKTWLLWKPVMFYQQ